MLNLLRYSCFLLCIVACDLNGDKGAVGPEGAQGPKGDPGVQGPSRALYLDANNKPVKSLYAIGDAFHFRDAAGVLWRIDFSVPQHNYLVATEQAVHIYYAASGCNGEAYVRPSLLAGATVAQDIYPGTTFLAFPSSYDGLLVNEVQFRSQKTAGASICNESTTPQKIASALPLSALKSAARPTELPFVPPLRPDPNL